MVPITGLSPRSRSVLGSRPCVPAQHHFPSPADSLVHADLPLHVLSADLYTCITCRFPCPFLQPGHAGSLSACSCFMTGQASLEKTHGNQTGCLNARWCLCAAVVPRVWLTRASGASAEATCLYMHVHACVI